MHWELWDTGSGNLLETFRSMQDGVEAVRDLLAINPPDFIGDLALGAMPDEDEILTTGLPPAVEGDSLLSLVGALPDASVGAATPVPAADLGGHIRS